MPNENHFDDGWFQYISKLNDRILIKRRASGFTTWAMFGFLAVFFYNMIDRLPLIVDSHQLRLLLYFALVSLATFLFGFITIGVILISQGVPFSDIRVAPRLSRISDPILYIPLLFFGAGFLLILTPVAIYAPTLNMMAWPYYVLGLFIVLNIATPIVRYLRTRWKLRGKRDDAPLLQMPPFFADQKMRFWFQLGASFSGLFFLVLGVITSGSFIRNTSILLQIDIVKLSFEIILCSFLIICLLGRLAGLLRQQFLETLERRIVLENLTSDEIKSIFIREFLGETTKEWIKKIEDQINVVYSSFQTIKNQAKKELLEIKEIDDTYEFEIEGRTKNILDKVEEAFKAYEQVMEKNLKHLGHLIDERGFTPSDKELLSQIISGWKEQSSDVASSGNEVIRSFGIDKHGQDTSTTEPSAALDRRSRVDLEHL